jgi:hypothetical protein
MAQAHYLRPVDDGGRAQSDEPQVLHVERAAVRRLRAQTVTVDRSIVGSIAMERGTVASSRAGIVTARSLACDEVRAGVLIAPVVRGDVHTLLDARSAVAVGFGMVLGKALLNLIGRAANRA